MTWITGWHIPTGDACTVVGCIEWRHTTDSDSVQEAFAIAAKLLFLDAQDDWTCGYLRRFIDGTLQRLVDERASRRDENLRIQDDPSVH